MGQTINMNQGQSTICSITVLDQNNNTVPPGDYTIAVTAADPTVVQASINAFGQPVIKALKVGSTTVSYSIAANSGSGYQGSLSLGPDTFNVTLINLASATNTYSKPQ